MSIFENLFDWQKKIVEKFKDRHSYGIFLDMGLGKTPISLSFAEQNECNKIIIVTINAKAIETEEIDGSWFWWLKKSKLNYELKSKSDQDFRNKNEALLINYEGLFSRSKERKKKVELKENIKAFIKNCKNEKVAVIVDESHKLKNLQSIQTGAVVEILKQLKLLKNEVFIYLLTGTPFTKGYEDLYSQLKILGLDWTKSKFIDEFCIRGYLPGLLGWQQPIVGYKNEKELYDLIHKYAITAKSEDVISLPEKVFINHITEQTEDFKVFTSEMLYPAIINKYISKKKSSPEHKFKEEKKKINNPFYRNICYPEQKYSADTTGSFWLRCREISIGFQGNAEDFEWYNYDRIKQLENFLKENEDNYLIFYNFTPELVEIYDVCERLGYNIDVFCGEVKSTIFYEKFHSQTEGEKLYNRKNVIIANFVSGSTGMNWADYNKCVIFSLPVYRDWQQGLKRIHRIGQKNTTYYHIFYQNNFLDLSMKNALEQKITYDKSMFESDLKRIKKIF